MTQEQSQNRYNEHDQRKASAHLEQAKTHSFQERTQRQGQSQHTNQHRASNQTTAQAEQQNQSEQHETVEQKPRKKTVLITGASSGIGKETVSLFANAGYKVFATVRRRDQLDMYKQVENVETVILDVTKMETLAAFFTMLEEKDEHIDILINNAGYGLVGPMAASTRKDMGKQFDTNVFGPVTLMNHVIPAMIEQQDGIIINVSSVVGRLTMPGISLYAGSKFALEGISESLYYELSPFNVKVKLVEPGAVKTDFAGRSMHYATVTEETKAWKPQFDAIKEFLNSAINNGAPAAEVANVIFTAATDGKEQLRYAGTSEAKTMLRSRKLLPDSFFLSRMKKQLPKAFQKE